MWPLLVYADFWLQGTWSSPLVGSANQDIYGTAITVGSYVKLVGIVTAVNLTDSHYGEIQVTPIHPGAVGPFIPDVQTGQPSQSPNFPVSNPQIASAPFGFHPKQLVVGV